MTGYLDILTRLAFISDMCDSKRSAGGYRAVRTVLQWLTYVFLFSEGVVECRCYCGLDLTVFWCNSGQLLAHGRRSRTDTSAVSGQKCGCQHTLLLGDVSALGM